MQLCSLFYSIARNRFIPTYIGDIVEWWVHDYNDVNGAELACNVITIKKYWLGISWREARKHFGRVQ